MPAEFSRLTALKFLKIGINRLTGTIPVSICAMSSLEFLCMNNNNPLTGTVPATFANGLNNLCHLELQGNELANGPTSFLEEKADVQSFLSTLKRGSKRPSAV